MKKLTTLFAALFLCIGMAQAQDVYYSGNHKIWKNDSLLYSLTDSINIQLKALQVAEDGTTYGAGYTFDTTGIQGRIWMNDSCVFTADTNTYFDHLVLAPNGWTAAGFNNVWQNGELLYSYTHGEDGCRIYGLAADTTMGDIYAGGAIFLSDDSLAYASVWQNDSLLWMEDANSSVQSICFDGENLYAAGFKIADDTLYGVVWQNDSIIYQMENANFGHIAAFDGSLYWTGVSLTDTVFRIWQDGEVLYALPELSGISNLVVNESGVYFTDAQTVYKDGEILYQPESVITGLVVMPSETPEPLFTLTVEADTTGWGSVEGGGIYPLGDTVSIEAFPNLGCEFLYWNDSITDNPRDVVITQDSTFTAHFGLIDYTITTSVDPENAGTVTEGGIYHHGDTLTIEAIPNDGYVFEMWNDSITDNPRNIVITQDSNFVALFSHLPCTIETQVVPEGSGFVTGAGVYPYGDTIQLEATPNIGYEFMTWDDGISDNPRTIVVTENHVYTATFGLRQCVVNTVAQPAEGGTVIGGGTYSYGDTILLVAQNNTGFQFKVWSEDDNLDNPRQIIVEDDVTFTAIFSPLQYEITTGCEPVEGGTVEGGGIYNYGETAVIYARPFENYSFVCWSDGIVSNPRHITVTQSATYKAFFNFSGTPQHTVKVIPNNPDWGTVSGEGTYPEGSVVEISATPTDSTRFVSWDDGITDNPRNITVTGSIVLVANFEPLPSYTITVRSISETMGVVYGSGTYPANMTVNIGAVPAQGFHFTGWQDGDMNNPRTITVTGDAEYVANFSQTPVQTYTVTVYYDEAQGLILGAGTYSAGSTATLVAIPADGFMFSKWSDGSTNDVKEVVVDRDIILAAFFTGTGIEEDGFEPFSLYPNPANDVIRIEGLNGEHEILVYNIYGMLVKTASIKGNGEISINDLAAGIYFLRAGGHAMKFVKE